MRAIRKKALADVTRRRGRTWLVALGIFIGVFGLVGINFTEDTLFSAIEFTYSGNQPDFVLTVSRLDSALLPTLTATSNVTAVQYQTLYDTKWHVSQAPGIFPITVESYPDLTHVSITPFQLLSGRLPGAGEIDMEYGDLGLQNVAVGDTVTVDGASGSIPLRVVGMVRTPGADPAASDRALAYMSDAGLAQLAGLAAGTAHGGLTYLTYQIGVKVQNVAQASTTAASVQQILHGDSIRVSSLDFPGRVDPAAIQSIHTVFSLLRFLAILAVVMSGFLILNTVTTLIAEQTAIIGTMKAMGGTRWVVVRGYLLTVVIYSVLGTLPGVALGLVAGYGLAAALAPTLPLALGPFALSPEVMPLGLGVGFGVPLVAALLPLWNGTRITVRDALAAYGVSAGQGNGPLSWLSKRLVWVPQTLWLGVSGTFRRRWRAALTLLTLGVAGVTFLMVQTAATSVNATVMSVYSHWDADVQAIVPPETLAQVQAQLNALPNVQRVERFAEDSSTDTPWGRLSIWGTDPDTQIYRYHLTSGRWLAPGDTNVVLLSDDAAAKSGLHIGDSLAVDVNGASATWTVIGTVDQTSSNIGGLGAAITTTDDLYQLEGIEQTGQTNLAPMVMIRAVNRSSNAVNQLADAVSSALSGAQAPSGPEDKGSNVVAGDGGFVTTLAQEAQRRAQNWFILYTLLYLAASIVAAAGVLGLANALVASVLERRREIGMLRAMGATGRRVAQVFWTEGLTLGGIAWLVSAALGLPLAYVFVQQLRQGVLPVKFVVDATAFVVMLVAIVVIALLAGGSPAARAARMRIADILRYE
jgi:putative ABC transport system permease protein